MDGESVAPAQQISLKTVHETDSAGGGLLGSRKRSSVRKAAFLGESHGVEWRTLYPAVFGESQMLLLGGTSWQWDYPVLHGFPGNDSKACWGQDGSLPVAPGWGIILACPFPLTLCVTISSTRQVSEDEHARQRRVGVTIAGQKRGGGLEKEWRHLRRAVVSWPSWSEMHIQPVHPFIPVSDVSGGKNFSLQQQTRFVLLHPSLISLSGVFKEGSLLN